MTSKNLESFIEYHIESLREFGERGDKVIKQYNLAYIEFLINQANILKSECDLLRKSRNSQSVKLNKGKFSRELAKQDKLFFKKIQSYKRSKPHRGKMKSNIITAAKQIKERDNEIEKQKKAYNLIKSDIELKLNTSPREDLSQLYENLRRLSTNLPAEYLSKNPYPSINEINQRRYAALYRMYNMYKGCGDSEHTQKIVNEMAKLYVKLPLKFRNKNNAPPKGSVKANTCN